jgi:hypothetical protein
VKVECASGFTTTSAGDRMTCVADNSYNTNGVTCVERSCTNNPSSVLITNIDQSATDCGGTGSGETCAIQCLSGYDAVGNNARCALGTWQSPLPTCNEQSCSGALSIANLDTGSTDCTSTASGQSCAFTCNTGYQPVGTLTCKFI